VKTLFENTLSQSMKIKRYRIARGNRHVISQGGFMLLELLTVLPIVSVLMGVMMMTTIMIMNVGTQNNNHVLTLTQVQNAGYWVTRDVMNGQVVTPSPSYGVLVRIEWDDWDSTHNTIDYTLDDGQLLRQKNGGTAVIVARNLVTDDTYFLQDVSNEDKYIFTVKASVGETQIERNYEVSMRIPSET